MRIGDKIFVLGKTPKDGHPCRLDLPHIINKNLMVRFVKDSETGALYFNMKDFLIPYKNNKKYMRIVKKILPRGMKNLERTWMQIKAWHEISEGIANGTEKDVISGWKERNLF